MLSSRRATFHPSFPRRLLTVVLFLRYVALSKVDELSIVVGGVVSSDVVQM